MKRYVILSVLVAFISLGCKNKAEAEEKPVQTASIENSKSVEVNFPVYDFEGLKPLLSKDDGKTYIVNFWATWCKPCIEELPYFEKTYAEQKENNVELILVSLDMPSMWEKRLVPFVEKNKLQGKVVILDDPKMNDWIPQIDENWGGGIPATLIYNGSNRTFFEQGFTYEELNEQLNKFL